MDYRIFFWALTSALAGFLFGFDTVVISGAEETIQALWGLGSAQHGLAMSMALWGTVLGSFVGGWPTDRFGRKKTLLSIGMLYFVSAIWSALAGDVNSFMVARFIGGLGVGISTVVAPLYISEIAPPEKRGRLTGLFQFNIVFGILIAFLSNWLIKKNVPSDAWRWMLGVEAVPALVYTLMCFSLPESPRWLVSKRADREAGLAVLKLIDSRATEKELINKVDEIAASGSGQATSAGLWSSRFRVPLLLAFLVAFFNQLSGINAILYFAPRIFKLAGLGEDAALLNSVGIGVTNLIFTFVGLYLIDRAGRRTLLFIGSLGYIASLGLCAWAFFAYAPQFKVANAAITLSSAVENLERAESLPQPVASDLERFAEAVEQAKQQLIAAAQEEGYAGAPIEISSPADKETLTAIADAALHDASEKSGSGGNLVMTCIFAFIAAHAIGQGAVIWVFISEIFPNQVRAAGQAFGSFTHWIFAAGLTTIFPWMISTFAPGQVFLFFCGMMVLQLVWVATMVPETKGVTLEEMQKKLGIA
ncbi:sugar porter family MFS transporter [Adhaeretor mobilis]|uniref:D-xylose-proton symporter n=1 Tax=Adhaeretor mobilis TaxID=1930276 RepID=A0A517MY51_9BACT|nr:sugar porter family MFS transporter [Adhaeretor mobilis]QDS99815.1 D-xylose-proton symporter [Adhaeretor mobilis]